VAILPVFSEVNWTEDLLGSGFATIMNEEDDFIEIKKENHKLRADLAEALSATTRVNGVEQLKEITTLKEKVSTLSQSKNQFLEDYEKRFTIFKQQLKEGEEKIQSLSNQLTQRKSDEENKKVTNGDQLKKLQEELKKQAEALSKKHQAEMQKLNLEKENARKTLFIHYQESSATLNEQIKTQRSEKEQAQSKLDAMMNKYKDLEREITNLHLLLARESAEVTRYKDKTKESLEKYEKLLTYCNLGECPVCFQFIIKGKLVEHVNGCA